MGKKNTHTQEGSFWSIAALCTVCWFYFYDVGSYSNLQLTHSLSRLIVVHIESTICFFRSWCSWEGNSPDNEPHLLLSWDDLSFTELLFLSSHAGNPPWKERIVYGNGPNLEVETVWLLWPSTWVGWLWRWLPHKLLKRQSLSTVFLKTTLTREVTATKTII